MGSGLRALVTSKVAGDSVWLVGGQVVSLLAGLGVHIAAARLLGEVGFGIWVLAFAAVPVVAVIAGFGLPVVVLRLAATGSPLRPLWPLIAVSVGLAALFGGLVGVVLPVVAGGSAVGLIWPVALWAGADVARRFPVVTLQGQGRFATMTLTGEPMVRLVTVVTAVGAGVTFGTVPALVWGAAVGAVVGVVAAGVAAWPVWTVGAGQRARWGPVLAEGRRLVAVDVMDVAVGRLDVWLVGALVGAASAGAYGAAAKLAGLVAVPGQLAAQLTAPQLARLSNPDVAARKAATGLLTTVVPVACAGAALAGAVLLVGGGWLLDVLFGAGYSLVLPVLGVLVAAQLVHVASGPSFQLLRLSGQADELLTVTLLGTVVLVVALVAVPSSVVGIATAVAVSLVVRNVLAVRAGWRHTGVSTLLGGFPAR